jgi:diguanylate cyclase (GGDEF)-like protein
MNNDTQRSDVATKLVSVLDYDLQSSLVKAIIEASPEGILVVNSNGIVVSINQRFFEAWRLPTSILPGSDPDNVIGTDDNPILHSVLERVKDKDAFLARVRELYDNPQLDDHCEIELMDGRTLERHSTVLRNADSLYLGRVWFFRDVTSRKMTENTLTELAHHDYLTGAVNRRYFFERGAQEFARSIRHSTPLSIAELDIDHFKKVNDLNGHAVGDEVLKSLCNTIQELLRVTDIFARIGGEEFALLLTDTNLDGAACLAERLRLAISGARLSTSKTELICTVSMGVASLRPADTSIKNVLLRADMALYSAKAGGRNRVEIET